MKLVKSNELATQIAVQMGLPIERLFDVQIHLAAGETAQVHCKFFLGADEAGALIEGLKRYDLCEKKP